MGGWNCSHCDSPAVHASRGRCCGPLTPQCGAELVNGTWVIPLGLVAPACSSEAAKDLWPVCPIAASDPVADPRLADLRHIYGRMVRFGGVLARDLVLSAAGETAVAAYHNELGFLLEVERARRQAEEEVRRGQK